MVARVDIGIVGEKSRLSVQAALLVGLDEGRADLRDDGVAVGAQSSHASGCPISQRAKAGFRRSPFMVLAPDPVRFVPWGLTIQTCRPSRPLIGTLLLRPSLWSRDVGVAQPTRTIWSCNPIWRPVFWRSLNCVIVLAPVPDAWASGVRQPAQFRAEPEPLADMRCAKARSAQIRRPDGVTRVFQVSRYKIEPRERRF